VAKKRADNFGAGFLEANAAAVFAEGITSASDVLAGVLKSNRSIAAIFSGASGFSGKYDFHFASVRSPGYTVWMDPSSPGRYYRSVVGNLTLTAAQVRAG
jgi:hypothetical protein